MANTTTSIVAETMTTVKLTHGYKAVIDNEVERLFKITGETEEAIWVSTDPYSFDMYSGDSLEDDPILGPVIRKAHEQGYAITRKSDNDLRQEIVVLLGKNINIRGKLGNAWYVRKTQASPQWTCIGSFPLSLAPQQGQTANNPVEDVP